MEPMVGLIGGGRMGEALIKGFIQSRLLPPAKIWVLEQIPERAKVLLDQYGVRGARDLKEILTRAREIILAVKPQHIQGVLKDLKGNLGPQHLLISIAAGIPLKVFYRNLGTNLRFIRTMPNTPALVLKGVTALSAGGAAQEEDLKRAEELFRAVGETVRVEEELLDAVTGLSGSGPAYLFLMAEALVEAGIAAGLPRETANILVRQTLAGATALMAETGNSPQELRDQVTSPGGTTQAGLEVLMKGNFRELMVKTVEAATARSKELGKAYA